MFLHLPMTWYTVTLSPAFTGTLISWVTCSKLLEVVLSFQSYPVVPETPIVAERALSTSKATSADTVTLLLPPADEVLVADIPRVIVTAMFAFSLCLFSSVVKAWS